MHLKCSSNKNRLSYGSIKKKICGDNLISNGKCVQDEEDKWSEHQPSAEKENKFIEENGKWYLGIEDEEDENNKGHYKFPLAILKMFIAVVYLPLKLELGSTQTY